MVVGRLRKVFFCTVATQPFCQFQHVTCVLGGMHGCPPSKPLICDPRQAMSEGKS